MSLRRVTPLNMLTLWTEHQRGKCTALYSIFMQESVSNMIKAMRCSTTNKSIDCVIIKYPNHRVLQ